MMMTRLFEKRLRILKGRTVKETVLQKWVDNLIGSLGHRPQTDIERFVEKKRTFPHFFFFFKELSNREKKR